MEDAARGAFEDEEYEPNIERGQLLRRQVARRCVYGVDLNPLATELARLSIWVHTFVPGLPLTFLDYNLVTGDSLAGIGTLDEVTNLLDMEQTSLKAFVGGPSVMEEIRDSINRLGSFADASAEQVQEARETRAEIESKLAEVEARFDILAASRVNENINPDVASDTEVDLRGHPAHERAKDALATTNPIHFPTAFPEVFDGDGAGFDALLGNPPWEEVILEEDEFWSRFHPGLQREESHGGKKEEIIDGLKSERPELKQQYERESREIKIRRKILRNGPFPGMGKGDPDTYKAFSWRFWGITKNGGYVGIVLPRGAFLAAGSEQIRRKILSDGTITDLTFLKNSGGWVFDGVGGRFTIGLLSFQKQPPSGDGELPLRGPFPSEEEYNKGIEVGPYYLSANRAQNWTGSAAFPMLPANPDSVGAFQQLSTRPPLDRDDPNEWRARPYRELDETNDKTMDDGTQLIHEIDDPPEDFWPVLDGGSLNPSDTHRWVMDTGSRFGYADPDIMLDYLQEARENSYRYAGTRSAFYEFDEEWVYDPDTLPCLDYRIAFRDVTQRTNQRTVLISLIPPKTFLTNKAPYFLWPRGNERDEAYLMGVLNSIPLDWYARRFVEINLNYHILNSFPIPRPEEDSPLRNRVINISGRLAAQNNHYSAWADSVGVDCGNLDNESELELINELDAVVAHLYGLSRDHIEVIFETFHDGWNYEERLTRVLDYYADWADRLDLDHVDREAERKAGTRDDD